MTSSINRRQFARQLAAVGAASGLGLRSAAEALAADAAKKGQRMQFGLVTYLWGKDMDLPTLLHACEKSGMLGVELRTQHAHRVEPTLSEAECREVKQRFADSPVTLVGYGSNAQFHEDDPQKVAHNIELTKKYVRLML